jgi:hypothetical protein
LGEQITFNGFYFLLFFLLCLGGFSRKGTPLVPIFLEIPGGYLQGIKRKLVFWGAGGDTW